MVQDERPNALAHYRKRMGFTQFQVARLLGWKNVKGLCQLESGRSLPTLVTAFNLSIIYRVPVEFLFNGRYTELREQMRTRETALAPLNQQPLPLAFANSHDS
jgi:transcriptional regulator with XRE-family HTH domain